MTHRTTRFVGLAALSVLALAASACGSDDTSSDTTAPVATTPGEAAEQPVSNADSITVYSGRSEELVQPIFDRFETETGIDVQVKYGDSADLALLIDEEAAAGRAEADIFLSQSPGSVGYLDGKGRLAPIAESILPVVPEQARDDDGRWIGISGRQRVLVYNTDLVDPAELPDSIFDLIDDRWTGQIGVAGGNGSFQDFVTAMRATEGEDVAIQWLNDLAALDPVPYPKNSAIVAAVGRGEIELGLVNHYYNYLALEENPDQPSANHVFAEGDPGAIFIVTAAAIIDGTDRADVANQLIEFLLSPESQRILSDDEYEYPLTIGVEPSGGLPPADFASVGVIDFEDLEGGLERTRELIADAGLES